MYTINQHIKNDLICVSAGSKEYEKKNLCVMDYQYINEIKLLDEYFSTLHEPYGVPFRRLSPELPALALGIKRKCAESILKTKK